MKEVWNQIKGFEDYEISNLGNIRSYNKTSDVYIHKSMRINHTKEGYAVVTLTKTRKYLVHRLVAETFIPNPDNLPEVNHKDCNKANNNIENWEWCSRTYNIKYGYANGERITIKQLCNEIEELKSRLEKIEANCYKVEEE